MFDNKWVITMGWMFNKLALWIISSVDVVIIDHKQKYTFPPQK